MRTKISKVLTVLVTVLSLAFLGATAVSSIARTDWKSKLNEYPRAKSQELQTQIDALKKQSDEYAALTPQTLAAIAADQKAMVAKSVVLNQYAATLEAEDEKLREANAATAVTAQEKLDIDKLRREEVQRLQAQYEELVSQRGAAEAEVLRLRDLVYQTRGVLQRAVSRNESLKETLGRQDPAPYDPAQDEDRLPPARFPQRESPNVGDDAGEEPDDSAAGDVDRVNDPARLTDPSDGDAEVMENEEAAPDEPESMDEEAQEEVGAENSSGGDEPVDAAESEGDDSSSGVEESGDAAESDSDDPPENPASDGESTLKSDFGEE
jgi:hypothetical protein